MKTTTTKLSREDILCILNAIDYKALHAEHPNRDEVATRDRLIKRLFRALDRVDG